MSATAKSTVAICTAFGCVSAPAHHSHGNYSMTEYIHLQGTVTEIHWINPHSWIYMAVTGDDGESHVWAMEGASVTELRRKGWAEDSIRAGDHIAVRCHRLRDGSNGCLLGYVTREGHEEKLFD